MKKDSPFLAIFATMRKWVTICALLLCTALPTALCGIRETVERDACVHCASRADARHREEASLLAAASVMLLAATESAETPGCSTAVKEQNAHHAALRRSAATLHNAPRPSRGERSLRAELPCPRPADRYVYALRRIVI